jgi:hypothetical protein
VHSLLTSLPGKLGSGLLGLTGRLFGVLFPTVTVVVLTICFMASLPRLRRGALRLMPHGHRALGPDATGGHTHKPPHPPAGVMAAGQPAAALAGRAAGPALPAWRNLLEPRWRQRLDAVIRLSLAYYKVQGPAYQIPWPETCVA